MVARQIGDESGRPLILTFSPVGAKEPRLQAGTDSGHQPGAWHRNFGLAMANYAGEAGLKGKTVRDDREISSCCSLT